MSTDPNYQAAMDHLVESGEVWMSIPERPIDAARNRVVEAAKAWVNTYWRTADHDNDLTSAVAELERLEGEVQP